MAAKIRPLRHPSHNWAPAKINGLQWDGFSYVCTKCGARNRQFAEASSHCRPGKLISVSRKAA